MGNVGDVIQRFVQSDTGCRNCHHCHDASRAQFPVDFSVVAVGGAGHVLLMMRLFGVDANIVALSGIAIAIGTVVDMGIVLCENILNRLDEAPPDGRQNDDCS